MKAQIGAIINGKNNNHERSSQPTIFHEILSSDLPPNEKSVARLWQEGQTVIGAGTETTAWTLSVIAYHVLANPDILSKLLAEMEGKNGLKELEQLPYMTAVIQEGLRLSFGVVAHLQRISPDQVLKFHDWEIPPGVCFLPIHFCTSHHPKGSSSNRTSTMEESSILEYNWKIQTV